MYTQVTTDFAQKLNKEGQDHLSTVIDDIERETYWETRQDILRILDSKREVGKLEEYLDYMLSKTKPGM